MTLDRTLMTRCFGQHLLAAGLLLAGMAIASAQPLPKNFIQHEAPKPIASIAFEDDQGRPRSFAEFRGKIVLLNIWATWCGPCRREMPSLDRLQGLLGGSDFEVVALSIDRAGLGPVRKFYADVGIRNLAIYIDSSGKATRELATLGVPAAKARVTSNASSGERLARPRKSESSSPRPFTRIRPSARKPSTVIGR